MQPKFNNYKRFTVFPEGGLENALISHQGCIVTTGAGQVKVLDFDGERKPGQHTIRTANVIRVLIRDNFPAIFMMKKSFNLQAFVAPIVFFNQEKMFMVGLTETRTM